MLLQLLLELLLLLLLLRGELVLRLLGVGQLLLVVLLRLRVLMLVLLRVRVLMLVLLRVRVSGCSRGQHGVGSGGGTGRSAAPQHALQGGMRVSLPVRTVCSQATSQHSWRAPAHSRTGSLMETLASPALLSALPRLPPTSTTPSGADVMLAAARLGARGCTWWGGL